MIRKLALLVTCATLVSADNYVVYQQGEVITATRPSTTPTALVFPFVTGIAGFETEITISNTSQDTLGSTPQSGSCTVTYFGSNGIAPQTSTSIPAGKQLVFRLTQGGSGIAAAPNFQGYLAASCAFPLARGTAKMVGLSANSLAFSQDAQVVALPRSTTRPQSLLFPYVGNIAGFDTGIAISNTSLDPFGTTPTAGACTLNFFGSNAPAAVTTPTIAGGTTYVTLASQVAPNFQGYVISTCNFTGVTGIAFVSDTGLRTVALSESPELITLPRTLTARPLLFSSVTNQNGLDSGIAVANTTTDPFGTSASSGTCTFNFYGNNAPAPLTTATIASGTVYTSLVSAMAPNFQGYTIANCSFPLARGWTFTANVGATAEGDAQSPEVMVVPRSNTPATLLFSEATNWNGADTKITISNTSQDPFGTSQAPGTCTISYFGDTANGGASPATQTSSLIQPGTQLAFTLSQGNAAQGIAATPNFHGYLMAGCGFPLARGTSAVSGNLATCGYNLLSAGASFGTAASNGNTVGVVTTAGTCGWTASSPVTWVVITNASGTGNGNATYNVLANSLSAPRSTTLTVAGLPFTVNQSGQGCQFGLTPPAAGIAANGGTFTSTVGLSGSDCTWTATSDVSWLTVTSASGGAGGILGYTAASNAASSVSRTGTITLRTPVSQTTFTVTESGAACSYSVSQVSQSFPGIAGTGTATVAAPAGCQWTVDSTGAPFVTITAGAAGSGNGTVAFSVAANPGGAARTGSLTIAGISFPLTQAGSATSAGCIASMASTPVVALEGRTEVLGDLLLNCSNLATAVTADVVLTLNTNATNTLISGSTVDATLFTGSGPQNGQIVGYNSLHWPGVVLGPGNVSVRISNVRADASLLGVGSNLQAVPVLGTIGLSAVQAVPVTNPRQTMATAAPSLQFQKAPANPATGGAQTIISLTYQETSAAAFHATGVATRFRMVLANIPPTVQVFAPVFPNEGKLLAQLYSADSNGDGGAAVAGSPLAGGTYQQLTVSNNSAVATWVVLAADSSKIETWTFPLLLTNATVNDLNAIQVAGSIAVVSDVGVASATAPVPRYRDFSVPQKLVNLRIGTQVQLTGGAAPAANKGGRSASSGEKAAGFGVGSSLTFLYTLQNDTSDASQTASNVTVRNYLPNGLNFVGCSSTGGVICGGSGSQVQVTYSQIPAGQSRTVTVIAKVDPALGNGTVLTSTVGAIGDQVTADSTTATAAASIIVLNGIPIAVASVPASGGGPTATFTYTFTHPYGFQNLNVLNVLVNNGLDARKACYLAYIVPISTLVLVNDAGDAGGPFAGVVGLNSQAIISNSQCSVSLVSADGVGNGLTLKLNITFTPSFGGNRIFYVAARDQAADNSDWQALGVWQAPWNPPGTIGVGGLTPARGNAVAGSAQAYTFTFTDTKGTADLGIINVLVNNGLDARKACYLAYIAASNTLVLVNDAGDAGGPFVGAITPGQPLSIENSQCMVSGAGGGAVANGNTLNLTFTLTFKQAFQGNRILYLAARDTNSLNNTDWQAMGTWGVQ